MILYNVDFPQLLETKYLLDDATKERMISTVLSQKDNANYHGGYTFHITDEYDDFKKLYQYFFNTIDQIVGPLLLSPRHKTWCWANVYNRDNFKTNLHSHEHSSSINAVFYLKIPTDIAPNEGGLRINIDDTNINFIPEEGDLIIMPSDVLHEPMPHSSDQFRIAINMEICTVNSWSTYYSKDKIYEHAKPKL
jgi:hypothetical protein